jgi:hypothetical protein
MRERWLVDGYELTDGAVRDVETRDGLYASAPVVGGNAVIPHRTGEVWRRKVHGPGGFSLNLWLGDRTSRAAVEALWDNLLRAVTPLHRLPKYERLTDAGEWRECYGEVVSALEPKAIGQRGIRIGIEVRVPAGYWRSQTIYTHATAAGAALPKALPLTDLAPSTAPMEQLISRVDGPINDPLVIDRTDGVDGEWWLYTGNIPTGQWLIVDSGTYAMSGGGGFVPDESRLTYNGPRPLVVPAAKPGGVPAVELRGNNGGAGTKLTVTGRRSYQA